MKMLAARKGLFGALLALAMVAVVAATVCWADAEPRDLTGLWEGVSRDGSRIFLVQIDEHSSAQIVVVVSPDVLHLLHFYCGTLRKRNNELTTECERGREYSARKMTFTARDVLLTSQASVGMPPAPRGGSMTARFTLVDSGKYRNQWEVVLVSRTGGYLESLVEMKAEGKAILENPPPKAP